MRKLSVLFTFVGLALAGCDGARQSTGVEETVPADLSREQIRETPFADLFRQATPEEIPADVFTLVGKDFTVLTAGDGDNYNSMVASWGGWGILFNKPTTWNFLRANRYTLEFIRDHRSYTMAYFDEEFKDDIMLFGTRSGRDTDKMKESLLTAVATPGGNIAYKEAKLIIECSLTQVTTVSPGDYYMDQGLAFVTEGYEDAGDWHKLVFGEITAVWIRK